MVSDPVLVNVEKLDSENIHVSVQIIRLMGFNDELISTGSVSVSANKEHVVERSESTNSLSVEIKSDYPDAWIGYLAGEADRLGDAASVDSSGLILTISGNITYTKRYHEVRVTIS